MKCKRLIAAATILGVSLCAVPSPATENAPGASASVKAFVRAYVRRQNDIGMTPDLTTRVTAAPIRDNDLVVFIWGHGWCGSGGCYLLILKRVRDGFKVLGTESIVHAPIRVLPTDSHGEPQIGVTVSGGGILPRYEAVLSFDGHSYPKNPSVPPARPLKVTQGRVVISRAALYSQTFSTLLYDSPHTKRIVKFADGEATIEQRGSVEHVVVTHHGQVAADSYCDATSGTYDRIVRFSQAIERAARDGDRRALAAHMRYPLQVNTAPGKSYFVDTKADLLNHFDAVFSARVLRRLSALEPNDVFCRMGQSMLANGTLWASTDPDGELLGTVVNV